MDTTKNDTALNGRNPLAEELERERERLRELAERLKKREGELEERAAGLAEMVENYPHFRAFVYAKLKEEALKSEPLDQAGFDALLRDAQPIEPFIQELERLVEERQSDASPAFPSRLG
jgi:hypothetical protein